LLKALPVRQNLFSQRNSPHKLGHMPGYRFQKTRKGKGILVETVRIE